MEIMEIIAEKLPNYLDYLQRQKPRTKEENRCLHILCMLKRIHVFYLLLLAADCLLLLCAFVSVCLFSSAFCVLFGRLGALLNPPWSQMAPNSPKRTMMTTMTMTLGPS